jgi:Fe2+ or Zn2+ uptake regulation protein
MNTKEQMLATLKRAGYKITIARRRVVEWLARHGGVFSAYDVASALPRLNGASVYRVLNVLETVDIIHPVMTLKGQQYYELHGGASGHHHHALCLTCGDWRCMTCSVEAPKISGFTVTHHSFVATGYCGRCT